MATEQAEGQESQDSGQDPMELVKEIDGGLQQVTQMLGQVSPDLAQGMMQVNKQFRAIIEQAMKQQGGGGGKQAAPQERPMNQGNASTQGAY